MAPRKCLVADCTARATLFSPILLVLLIIIITVIIIIVNINDIIVDKILKIYNLMKLMRERMMYNRDNVCGQ